MKKIEIKNPEIVKILEGKNKKSNEILKIVKKMEKLEKDYQKLVGETKRADEKVRPLIKERYIDKTKLEEFEEVSRVHRAKKGVWQIEIVNRLEEFKELFKKRNEKKDEKSGHNNSTSQ